MTGNSRRDSPKQHQHNHMATKLYVGNLSFDTTENDIQDLFAEAGTVREAVLIQDKLTGKSRGFAFVTMSTDEEAQTATQRLNGKTLHGRNLTVNEARPREDFAGAGGGARNKNFGGGGNRGGRTRRF
jgi:cold-inducible RNA-binding protein